MKQKVVVLGGGTFQIGLITELMSMGFEVHVVTNCPQDQGAIMADKCHEFSFTEINLLTVLMQELSAVQLFTTGSELGLAVQAEVQSRLGKRGNPIEFVHLFQDKSRYKSLLLRSCKDCVPETHFYSDKDSELLKLFVGRFKQGVVVKPVAGGGSKSVARCPTAAEVFKHLEQAQLAEAIIEEYLEGSEYGGDFLVSKGQLLFESCTLKQVNKWLVPQSHLMLAKLQNAAKRSAFFQKIIRQLNLADGVYNADLRESDGQLKLIDLSPRIGGNCIPDLVKLSTGVNEWQLMAELLLDRPLTLVLTQAFVPHGVFMIGARREGEIQSLVSNDHPFGPAIVDLFWRVSEGEQIEAFTEGARHLGYVIYKAKTDNALLTLQQKIEYFDWFTLVE